MTSWHKRLLFFLVKILGAILILAVIALILYYNFYFKKDNLIKYIPANALVYATFRLDEKLLQQPMIKFSLEQAEKDYHLPAIDLSNINNLVGYNAAFAVLPNQENNITRPDYLAVLSLKPNFVGWETTFNSLQQAGLKYELLTNNVLDHNILLVSNSQSVIDQVKKINTQEADSLIKRINVVVNLKQLSAGYQAKIYLNVKDILAEMENLNDLPVKLMASSLKEDKVDDLYLGLKIENQSLVIETDKKQRSMGANSFVLDKLPQDFSYSLAFSKGNQEITRLLANLAAIDPTLAAKIAADKQYWQEIYKFNLENDILPLLANQCQIVVDKGNKWALGVNLEGLNEQEAKIAKLEEIIKEYVALNNPLEEEKQLPDNTYITQIVKNPQASFVTDNISNSSLKSIRVGNDEFAYFIKDNKLFLANSKQILEKLLLDQELVVISNINNDNYANFSQNVVVSGSLLASLWSGFGAIGNLIISDNLVENRIRLILENK